MIPAIPILQAAEWGPSIHGFTGRAGGVSADAYSELNLSFSVNDDPERVAENWRRLQLHLHDVPLVIPRQVHGTNILVVEGDAPGSDPSAPPPVRLGEADAIVCDRPGIAVGVLTADCVPILLRARSGRCVAAIHAGWRGTAAGIVGRVLEVLTQRFSLPVEQVEALLGPSIGGCCYEVEADVAEALGVVSENTKVRVDLRRLNARQLELAGVRSEAVLLLGGCTRCEADAYFSHRASGGCTGRQLSFVGIPN